MKAKDVIADHAAFCRPGKPCITCWLKETRAKKEEERQRPSVGKTSPKPRPMPPVKVALPDCQCASCVVCRLRERRKTLPVFEVGRGSKRHECRNYRGCLDRFVFAAAHLDLSARCPMDCSHFEVIPRHARIELAMPGESLLAKAANQ